MRAPIHGIILSFDPCTHLPFCSAGMLLTIKRISLPCRNLTHQLTCLGTMPMFSFCRHHFLLHHLNYVFILHSQRYNNHKLDGVQSKNELEPSISFLYHCIINLRLKYMRLRKSRKLIRIHKSKKAFSMDGCALKTAARDEGSTS